MRQLETELGIAEGCARITAFASPRNDGVSVHFDAEEVFSVQLQGSKRFHVAPVKELSYPFGMQYGPRMAAFDDLYPQASQGFPSPDSAEFETIEMRPGSVLFMPRGTWHRTRADQDSLSVSIILRPPSAAESVLHQLRALLLQDARWRRPLYGAWGDDAARGAALARVRELLANLPGITMAICEQDLAPPAEAQRLAQIEPVTRFQRIPGAQVDAERRSGVQILKVKTWDAERGERTTLQLEAPPKYLPTLEWLSRSKAAFSAGELADRFPEVPFDQHKKILDVLARAGFLRLLWFRSLPKGQS